MTLEKNNHNLNHATSDLAEVLLLKKWALKEVLEVSRDHEDQLKDEIEHFSTSSSELEDQDWDTLEYNQAA